MFLERLTRRKNVTIYTCSALVVRLWKDKYCLHNSLQKAAVEADVDSDNLLDHFHTAKHEIFHSGSAI